MRHLSEFLGPREQYILENMQIKSCRELALELDLSTSRVAEIKRQAERKVRREKNREQLHPDNQKPVTLTLTKKDLYVLDRALAEYIVFMNKKHVAPLFPDDPLSDVDYESSKNLQNILQKSIL